MGNHAFRFLLLLGIWVIFSGQFDAFHLILGVLSAAFVTWISGEMILEGKSVKRHLATLGRLSQYLVWLLWEVVLSNLHLLRLAMVPGGMADVQPRVVAYRTALRSEFARFLLANSITLTPGTVTMRIEDDLFYIHAISAKSAAGLDGEMERRIAEVFDDEKEAVAILRRRQADRAD